MPVELEPVEARVLGCLMEKSVITPDQYPLTLNALTSACNQKSSRDPVMSLSPGEVEAAVRRLQEKHLVRIDENFRTQVKKVSQRFCNTPFSDQQLDGAEFAVLTVLLLRGPRTPGELRSNVGRLHTFADNDEVLATLESLSAREGGPLVVRLPRTPGRRDAQWVHTLMDQANTGAAVSALDGNPAASRRHSGHAGADASVSDRESTDRGSSLDHRVSRLEARVAELEDRIRSLLSTADGT